ncbi:DUF4192 domain-containing protein [Nocardiopsis composta]|uniref:DUF4192 domain-containing protein n=1 Tax=Nocardiopsis composta TaxID=157465 RepID=A0A7W8QST5_9ACTN|nr:DUF4192 domain-containing protein [Nocardiopsis composta]MBB5435258.1 hypothetical protein [Nocardiopsis composta]
METATPWISVRRSGDVVGVVPYLVGYHPNDAVVVVGVHGATGRIRFVMCSRPPLPDPADVARRSLRALREHGCTAALLVGYGPAERITPQVDAFAAAARAHGVELRDALRVTDGRYWSYLCASTSCCPPEGNPVDPAGSAAVAEAVARGFSAWPDRAALLDSIAPAAGEQRARMDRATVAAEARCARMWSRREPGGHASFSTAFRAEGLRAVRAAVDGARAGRPPEAPAAVAWLALLLVSVEVRDEAWLRIDPAEAGVHVDLWRRVLRLADPCYTAAPGSLLAFAAWLRGDLALADAALDRVARAVPDYSMAALIRRALDAGMPPGGWRPPAAEWPARRGPD